MTEQEYLASIIECEEKQDSNIKHEWLLDLAEGVRVANYLRGHGYKARTKKVYLLGRFLGLYVGVDFKTLIK